MYQPSSPTYDKRDQLVKVKGPASSRSSDEKLELKFGKTKSPTNINNNKLDTSKFGYDKRSQGSRGNNTTTGMQHNRSRQSFQSMDNMSEIGKNFMASASE